MTKEAYERIIAQASMTSDAYDKQIKVEVQCQTIEGWQHAHFCRNAMEADAYIQRMPRELWPRYRVVDIPADRYAFPTSH